MSKKKTTEEHSELDFAKSMIKRYGDVISLGTRIFEKQKDLKTLSVSPAFDLSLNGGLLEGTTTIFSGLPKCGKTTSVLQLCKNAQDEGRKILYLDGESRIKNYNLEGVEGLDLSKMVVMHRDEGGSKTSAEDFLNMLSEYMQFPEHKGALAVIDSSSSLMPRGEMDAEARADNRNAFPRLMAYWLRQNSQIVSVNKIILVIIAHYSTNTSGRGKAYLTDGGLFMQYQADTIINCKAVQATPWLENNVKVGQSAEWEILSSAKGASGRKCTSYLRYGKGIDKIQEILILGEELGLIDKAGSWYYQDYLDGEIENYDRDAFKHQGVANIYEDLNKNPKYFEILERKVREMLK